MIEKNVVGVEKKEEQMPVFKADTLETEEDLIQPVASVSGVSSVAPVSSNFSSIDAIGMWRLFSERLKNRRLGQFANQNQLNPSQNNQPEFQDDYEQDNILISGADKSRKFLDNLLEKLWYANLEVEPERLHKIEEEEYKHPDDGIIRVSDVMCKDVTCIIESTPIEFVASIFNKKHITSVPVVHYLSKHLEGILTMSDIVFHIFNEKPVSTFHTEGSFFRQDSLALLERPVSHFMQKNVIQITPDATIQEACKLMAEKEIHRLIVTKSNKVRGILTTSDITKFIAINGVKKMD